MQTLLNYLPSFLQHPLFWVLAILIVAVVLLSKTNYVWILSHCW
ncbi:di- and tricarboxylate transporter [Actinobacillus pleuropneumoniae]|nr:di- and tricarboxylate transporter [Actinobacillus pleuropneumoniae]